MKIVAIFLFMISVQFVFAQNKIEWDEMYTLQLSDFESPESQIGDVDVISLQTSSSMNFGYAMSSSQFMFTKNFNSLVDCSFSRSSSSLIAPDSVVANKLLKFAQFEFDLSELHARILRKEIFEKKKAFSDFGFFQPIYEEVEFRLNQRHASALKATNLGQDEEVLKKLHLEVRNEIMELEDYCKTCKPPKKKKNKTI
tara:strand:- start:24090 stop:24683 length:594 start_codon:yes stop_codon:yes gene_type:complete